MVSKLMCLQVGAERAIKMEPIRFGIFIVLIRMPLYNYGLLMRMLESV
jgi:hypothetical protein